MTVLARRPGVVRLDDETPRVHSASTPDMGSVQWGGLRCPLRDSIRQRWEPRSSRAWASSPLFCPWFGASLATLSLEREILRPVGGGLGSMTCDLSAQNRFDLSDPLFLPGVPWVNQCPWVG